MTQPAKIQEPSMEEILASIRRIIADDDATKSRPRSPEAASVANAGSVRVNPQAEAMTPDSGEPPSEVEPAPRSDSDILDLTEEMAAPERDAAAFRTITGEPDVVFADAAERRGSRPAARPSENPQPRAADDGPLLSSASCAAIDTAFNALARTVLLDNPRTLEDLVKELLRPMLKTWLDDNLPGLVERLVRAEIERVSRGRP